MDILAQVTALLRIRLVGARKPFERRTVFFHCIPVQVLVTRRPGRNGLKSSHTQGSRSKQGFLTNLKRKNLMASGCLPALSLSVYLPADRLVDEERRTPGWI